MDHTRFFELQKSGEISGLYLFHGEEEYVKQSALSQLIERIDPVSRDMNVQEFEKPNADSVQLACETLPFCKHLFSPKSQSMAIHLLVVEPPSPGFILPGTIEISRVLPINFPPPIAGHPLCKVSCLSSSVEKPNANTLPLSQRGRPKKCLCPDTSRRRYVAPRRWFPTRPLYLRT